MTVAIDLVDVLCAAIEQADPEQRERLRHALDVDAPISISRSGRPQAYTPAALAEQVGISPRAIRGAIARGELNAVKRGRSWIIPADAVDAWAAGGAPIPGRSARGRAPRRRAGRGPMRRALG